MLPGRFDLHDPMEKGGGQSNLLLHSNAELPYQRHWYNEHGKSITIISLR